MIKNIIFDLGGVIININYQLTLNVFKELGAVNIQEKYSQSKQSNIFDLFETGKISADAFYNRLCSEELDLEISRQQFDMAWNAMLLDLDPKRLQLIEKLRHKYKTFLFSNTNCIHIDAFNII